MHIPPFFTFMISYMVIMISKTYKVMMIKTNYTLTYNYYELFWINHSFVRCKWRYQSDIVEYSCTNHNINQVMHKRKYKELIVFHWNDFAV